MAGLGDAKRKVAEYEAKGDVKKAIEELEKAIKEFPKEGSLFNKLGDLYIKVNRKDDALNVYENGARVFKEETYFPNAIALCKKILRLDNNRTEVYGLLGELHKELDQRGEAANYFLEYAERKMKNNDLEAALKTYNIIKELVPNNPKILETISAIYEKVGKKEEGAEFLKEAQELESKQEKLKESLVPEAEAVKEEKPATSEQPVEETKEEEVEEPEEENTVPEQPERPEIPEPPETPTPVSEAEEEVTEVEESEETSLEDLVSPEVAELLKEDEPTTPEKESIAAVEEEAVPEKEEVVEELSAIDKTIELAELYLNLGSEEEAVDCFRNAAQEAFEQENYDKALELNRRIADLRPFDLKSRQHMVEIAHIKKDKQLEIDTLLDLAESLMRREAKSEARSVYKKILKLDPDNSTAKEMSAAIEQPKDFIDLGEVLRAEMADEQKIENLQSIEGLVSQFRREVFESIGEGDFRSRYDLGVAYKGMGLYQEAIEEFSIASKDEELKLKALEMIGSCFLERNKIDEAINTLQQALKITGHPTKEYFGIYFMLGDCYEKKKDIKTALKYYMAAFKIDKTVPELTKKINELKNKYLAATKKTKSTAASGKAKKAAPKTGKVAAKKSKITYL